jgi:hypothetical protein
MCCPESCKTASYLCCSDLFPPSARLLLLDLSRKAGCRNDCAQQKQRSNITLSGARWFWSGPGLATCPHTLIQVYQVSLDAVRIIHISMENDDRLSPRCSIRSTRKEEKMERSSIILI